MKKILFGCIFGTLYLLFFSGAVVFADKTIETELKSIEEELGKAIIALDKKDTLEGALVGFSSLASRLEIFEALFGVQPQNTEGWKTIRNKAENALKKAKAKMDKEPYFNADSAGVAYSILLEIAGHNQEALDKLGTIEPGGDCGNWAETVMFAVHNTLSGIYERMGKIEEALNEHEKALESAELSLYFPSPDIFYTRYGILLAKNGRQADAFAQWQRVVDLYPQTMGAKISRSRLEKENKLIIPTAERIQKLYFNKKGRSFKEEAIFALAKHRFPESFSILSGLMATADEWLKNRLIPALGDLGDKKAISILSEVMKKGSHANCNHALSALNELGDRSQVVPFFERIKTDEEMYNIDWTDQVLREIYGGGPEISKSIYENPVKFVELWMKWLKKNKHLS